jgi:iron complex transport system substrate-binding protein
VPFLHPLVSHSTHLQEQALAPGAASRARAILCALLVCVCAWACEKPSVRHEIGVVDDFGDTVSFDIQPKRIVSLAPATTEILFALGAANRVIGRSSYDVYPDSALRLADLGPGIRPNSEAVLAARPDLILLYASEDNRPATRRFRQSGIATLSIKMDHVSDFERVTLLLGRMLRDTVRSRLVVDSVMGTIHRVRKATASLTKPTVVWPLWEAPLIVVGAGSFMNELIEIAGGTNVYASNPAVSPPVAMEDILQKNPSILITTGEGEKRKRPQERWRSWFSRPNAVVIVDTMLVGRPATRLGEAAVSLAKGLHPGIVIEGVR